MRTSFRATLRTHLRTTFRATTHTPPQPTHHLEEEGRKEEGRQQRTGTGDEGRKRERQLPTVSNGKAHTAAMNIFSSIAL